MTSGVMQIGWSTLQTSFTNSEGVGDDHTSYAYDGFRKCAWNKERKSDGDYWVMGDVIGTLIDLDKQ